MQVGFCKLHRRDEPLCKAHILPNALYKHLRKLGADGFWLNKIGSGEIKRIPGGLYDRNMLCSAADNEFGRYDQYAMSLFKEECPSTIFIDVQGREMARIESLDVRLLNLFLLSYIWRCHHSQVEAFKGFCVGSIFEERIRQKLLHRNGDHASWFSFMITIKYGSINDVVLPIKFPTRTKIQGINYLILYFLNFKFVVKLDSRSSSAWFKAIAATEDKPVLVPVQAYHASKDYALESLSVTDLIATGARW